MPRHAAVLLALATLSATAVVSTAQNADPAGPSAPPITQAQPAPIERANAPAQTSATPVNVADTTSYTKPLTAGEVISPGKMTASAQATSGVFLRAGSGSTVQAISASVDNTELKVEHGVANISVHQPDRHARILVDLPGGQTDLLKDGFYTFNADTNTVRVLKGEAYAYPSADKGQKPIKVKENHAVIFGGRDKAFGFDPFEARADLVPYSSPGGQSNVSNSSGYGSPYDGGSYDNSPYDYGFASYDPYGMGMFGDGFYGGYYPFGLGLYGGGFYGGGGYYGGGYYGGGYGGYDGDHDGDGRYGDGFRGGNAGSFRGGPVHSGTAGGFRGGPVHSGGGFHGGTGGGGAGGGGFHGGGGGGGARGGGGGGHR